MAILKRLFLVFLFNLFLTPCFVIAASLPENSYTYTIDAGKASITGYTGTDSDIIIPALIDGCSVESISNGAFEGLESLERVELSEGIKRIGSSAFADCENLEDIILPDSLISLGSDAFFNCNKLKKLTIPPNTTEIGSWPYFQCNVLEAILVDDDNQEYVSLDGVLFSKDMKTLIRYPQGKKDSAYCIPEGVVTIGDAAFMDCQNLETISVATTVTQIDAWAFNGCTNIKQFIVPNGVTSIGSRAFDQSGITSITFPKSVEEWGTCVLWSNIHLEQIEFLDESPSEALSRCIIEDELVMPNLEAIYVPDGAKGEYKGVLEEYFHSYIQEREKEWNGSTPAATPTVPVGPTPSVSDKDYGKTKAEVIRNIGYSTEELPPKEGDTGAVILFIQDILDRLGLYEGVVSGNFGYRTKEAVMAFQTQNGIDADGVCGTKTMDLLIEAYLELVGASTGQYNDVIYNLSWFEYKNTLVNLGLKKRRQREDY